MSFAVLAASDENSIFLGKCAENRVAFGVLCIATPAADPFTGGQKTQPFNIAGDVIETEVITLENFQKITGLREYGIPSSALVDALIATARDVGEAVVCSIVLRDGRRILAQMNKRSYRNVSKHLSSRQNWKTTVCLRPSTGET